MLNYFQTLLFKAPSKEVERAAIRFLKIEFAVLFLFGLILPNSDWYLQPWAIELSNWVAYIIPQIDRFTEIGIEPEVNRLYFSILWTLSPLTGFVIYKQILSKIYLGEFKFNKKKIEVFQIDHFVIYLITVFCFLGLFVIWFPFDTSPKIVLVALEYKILRSIFAFIVHYGVIWSLLVLPCIYVANVRNKIKIKLWTWSKNL